MSEHNRVFAHCNNQYNFLTQYESVTVPTKAPSPRQLFINAGPSVGRRNKNVRLRALAHPQITIKLPLEQTDVVVHVLGGHESDDAPSPPGPGQPGPQGSSPRQLHQPVQPGVAALVVAPEARVALAHQTSQIAHNAFFVRLRLIVAFV